ncbi:MAG: hypothetical protein GX861_00075 [Tenericutes bacterium]|jgi:hypothetical protein|nr:hypothetical protein [Mycoplasmatota bacterium]
MKELNLIIADLGISKVRLAKYLGVSRQMLYNYLALNKINDWPKEKAIKLFNLLGINNEKELEDIKVDGNYIIEVEGRLNEGVKTSSGYEIIAGLKGFNKKEQELMADIINVLKEKLSEDKSKNGFITLKYLYNFLQSIETTKELNYILAYISKSIGFTDPMEFVYNADQQFIFESILFSAITLYNNGGASKSKLSESHKRFVDDIEQKKEQKLSRTQELNTAKVQALKELGFDSITEDNAKEVLEKIAEIQSRKV